MSNEIILIKLTTKNLHQSSNKTLKTMKILTRFRKLWAVESNSKIAPIKVDPISEKSENEALLKIQFLEIPLEIQNQKLQEYIPECQKVQRQDPNDIQSRN